MTPQLTYKNHFVFGYNDKPFSFRQSPDDRWFVRYGSCQRAPASFRQECILTAQIIRKETKDDLFVMFSGGIDSEVVIRSFVEAQIPVRAAILRFKNGLNEHDIAWAIQTCRENNIEFQFYDLDILEFWKGDYLSYSDPTYCVSPQLLPTMWLADQIPGFPIMGSGECFLARPERAQHDIQESAAIQADDWELYEREKIAAWYRHFMIRNRSACPGFFQYTPEIMLSFLQDPFNSALCLNQNPQHSSTATAKLSFYQSHFPEIKSRPKYTGYEKLQNEDAILRKQLMDKYKGANQIYKTRYRELMKGLQSS